MNKVCFFNSHEFWGGGEKQHLECALEFKERNYSVTLLAGKNSVLAKKGKENGISIFTITVDNLSFLNPIKIMKLVRYYKRMQIDAVIFSSSQDLKLGAISAKIAGVKKIVYLRGLASEVNGSIVNRYIFKSALTHIIANSQETKRTILKNLSKYIDNEKVKVIYYGIDISSVEQNRLTLDEITQKPNGIILGNAGRLTAQKGHNFLIEIAKKLKDRNLNFTLYIAGSGELQKELASLIIKHGLQKEVVLLGFVSDMEAFMNSIDIFLLTSAWEGFGYVLVEAMIKRKPVVAFNITSNPEVVKRDKTGFLVDYPDCEKFAQRTQELIENGPLRKKFGDEG